MKISGQYYHSMSGGESSANLYIVTIMIHKQLGKAHGHSHDKKIDCIKADSPQR